MDELESLNHALLGDGDGGRHRALQHRVRPRGTAVQFDRKWPEHYGVKGDYAPDGFYKQLAFPLTWRG